MKKNILATSVALALGASSAQAAFTQLTDGNYQLVITGGCYSAGNCQADNNGVLQDNDNTFSSQTSVTVTEQIGEFLPGTYGSGIAGDGLMGVIDFTLSGSNISINSFSLDSFTATYGGTLYLDAPDISGMGGTIDTSGNMNFDPTGQRGVFNAFATVTGANPWNIDDSLGGDGLYDTWTTGTSTNRARGSLSPAFTMTGSALQDATAGMWTGTLVSAANHGTAVTGFGSETTTGVQISTLYNITITASASVVPVPAAAWLFGSGLLGLIGMARKKRKYPGQ